MQETDGQYNPKALAAEAQVFKDTFYALCEEQLHFLHDRFGDFEPSMGIVLGSGLGGLTDSEEFQKIDSLPFDAIPGMTKPGTPGHKGELHWGTIRDLPVMLWAGRVQTTDFLGWNTTPARAARLATMHLTVAKGLGVEAFVLTSAAGIVHTRGEAWRRLLYFVPKVQKGDIVAVADYSTFMPGASPLLAPFDERFGQRFNGKDILDPRMFGYIKEALTDRCHVGGYVLSPSTPNFEGTLDLLRATPPEGFIAQSPQSVIVVGMSMPPELDVLNVHNDKLIDSYGFDRRVRILALSLGTNDIAPARLPTSDTVYKQLSANPATHDEVSKEGKSAEERLIPAVAHVCERLQQENA